MDLRLHRPRHACATTGRDFAAGETFYSALVRGADGLERIDCCAEAWAGPPPGALCWWRSTYAAQESAGPSLAPVEVLLDVLEELDGRPDEAALRYLLALQLVRRRVLRIVDAPADTGPAADLVLACRKRDREYRVPVPPTAEAASPAVAERLTALVWSGGAA
jgi:hypothetical protein